MRARVISRLAEDFGLTEQQIERTIALRERGETLPFIATYRPDETAGLDVRRLHALEEKYRYYMEFEKQKATKLHTIQKLNKLTPELKEKIGNCFDRFELEDLYLPFRPEEAKENPEATARKEFIQPFIQGILEQSLTTGSIEEFAQTFISDEHGLKSTKDVISYAEKTLIEQFSMNADYRKTVREHFYHQGIIHTRRNPAFHRKRKLMKYQEYFDYKISLAEINAPKIHTLFRGVHDGVFLLQFEIENGPLIRKLGNQLITNKDSISRPFLMDCLKKAVTEQIQPSIENEAWIVLKERADKGILEILISNLQKLLLSPPFGKLPVLGIDPAYKAGCKYAVVGENGEHIVSGNLLLHGAKSEEQNPEELLCSLINDHGVKAIVVGDGAASRETDQFVKNVLRKKKFTQVVCIVMPEVGASSYAVSKIGKAELPHVPSHMRGAVSIARRFQDPVRELVKIEPKALAMGPFHHELKQNLIRKELNNVIHWTVCSLGVDVNDCSASMLSYISGINHSLAKRIVKFINEKGNIKSKFELLQVPHFGKKAFYQAAGFLRVFNGENKLDETGIHPDHYKPLKKLAKRENIQIDEMFSNKELWDKLTVESFETNSIGPKLFQFIKNEMLHPGQDHREKFQPINKDKAINTIEDIRVGMILKGRVSNVTEFGAFVDIGVHQDGLIHISEISNDYVKETENVLAVGDIIDVKVLKVEPLSNRISLSIKALESPKPLASTKKKKKKKKKIRKVTQQKPKKNLPQEGTASLEDLIKHFNRLG